MSCRWLIPKRITPELRYVGSLLGAWPALLALSLCTAQPPGGVPASPRSVATDLAPQVPAQIVRGAEPASHRRMESYQVTADRLEPAWELLRAQYDADHDVDLTIDRRSARIFMLAPPAVHQRVARWIASWPGANVRQVQYAQPRQPEASQLQLVQQTETPVAAGGAAVSPNGPVSPVKAQPPATGELMLTEASESVEHADLLRRLGFDVQIEILPGQDALVLRGRDVDVDAVAEIIREIERVADRAKPQIEIIALRQMPGGRLVDLFDEVAPALMEGRQGRVVAKSVRTPNAVLLIGWGEAFASAKTLIDKLDQPVAPQQQIEVFRLRHASAQQAQAVVREFMAGRSGDASAARVVADQRSNALIVHASPSEMAEVSLLVEQLDVGQSDAVKQVRVFQIRHALAPDLVDTLRTAIEAAQGGNASPSAALELLTIAGEGGKTVRSGLLDGVEITANAQTNSLVVSGPPDALPLLAALIERLDQPISTSQIKVFRIEHGDANSPSVVLKLDCTFGADQGFLI